MIIEPKVRGFMCLTAHPKGCEANVKEQIEVAREVITDKINGPKNVLIIGSSTGYGLASAITSAFGYGANTYNIFFEKPPKENKTGSAGYYNMAAFANEVAVEGLQTSLVNGDAFSNEVKNTIIEKIKEDGVTIDLVIYSLASPRRTDPETGETFSSVLKPIGEPYTYKNLNTDKIQLEENTIEPATDQEIADTVKVMGGQDWELWANALADAGVLSQEAQTVAYTYLGEKITWPIYGKGTIGKAKEDLTRAAIEISSVENLDGKVAVLKALVTQASSAIPTMALYLSLLYKFMKEADTHEVCIDQITRLFSDNLFAETPKNVDSEDRYRLDGHELTSEIQDQVIATWPEITEENLYETTDFKSYQSEFLKLFGFGIDGVDYTDDVDPLIDLEVL